MVSTMTKTKKCEYLLDVIFFCSFLIGKEQIVYLCGYKEATNENAVKYVNCSMKVVTHFYMKRNNQNLVQL